MSARFIWLRRSGTKKENGSSKVLTNTASMLHVDLVEVPMHDPPAYDAISYTWDGQKPDQTILCNGKRMLVTQNCHHILSQLNQNPSREAVAIWIDAICIDQTSIAERNYQVSIMSDIFRSAQRVLVWPGICSQMETNILLTLERALDEEDKIEEFRRLDDEYTKAHSRSETEAFLNHFPNRFFRRPWFNRMWTMQEAIVPNNTRKISFLIGSKTLSFIKVVEAARRFSTGVPQEANNAMLLEHYRQLLYPDPSFPMQPAIHQLFSDVRRKGCMEPKDKIFALHGILSVMDPDYHTPDYRRDVVDIFTEAAVWTMVKQEDLRMLHYAFKPQRELAYSKLEWEESQKLPSWVPDFTLPANRACKICHNPPVRHNTSRDSRSICAYIPDKNILRVRGHFCGTVDDLAAQTIPKFRNLYFNSRQYAVDACETMLAWFRVISPVVDQVGIEIVEELFQDFSAHWGTGVQQEYIPRFVRAVKEARDYRMRSSSPDAADRAWELIDVNASGAPRFLTEAEGWNEMSMIRQNWIKVCRELEDFCCLTTEAGAIGFGFGDIKKGDRLTIISGLDLIMFLRPGGEGTWRLAGLGYVYGLMDGSAWPDDEDALEDIDLV